MAQHMYLYTDCPECDGSGEHNYVYCDMCAGCGKTPVRVKALEWVVTMRSPDGTDAVWQAESFIIELRRGRYHVRCNGLRIGGVDGLDTLWSAQMACQTDHERMVMAMLEIVP